MDQTEFLLGLLYAIDEPLDGRTAIQKLAYFASVMTKTDMGYFPHFYGPYSAQVAATLENSVALDFIVETGRSTMRDRIMYTYGLTKDGASLAKRAQGKYAEQFAVFQDVVNKCRRIAHFNIYVLSWAAKVHYIVSQSAKPLTLDEARAVGKSFGWKLSEEETQSAIRLLTSLKLVKRA